MASPDPRGGAYPDHGRREDARSIFLAGVEAADPTDSVRRSLEWDPHGGALRVLAVGKAAVPMARAALDVLPKDRLVKPCIAVTHDAGAASIEGFRVLSTGHPVPDARGTAAAAEVENYISAADPEDGLLLLLSGGGSALLPAAVEGISLEDKATVTRLLLECGATIGEVNTVRKHLSRLKGGRLAARARPARVESLIVSDVVGNDLSSIASGPTAPDPTTFQDAWDCLERLGIRDRIPRTVAAHLQAGLQGDVADTPKPGDPVFDRVRNRIIASNVVSLEAAAAKARSLGYETRVLSDSLTGEAREVALDLVASAREVTEEPIESARRLALLSAGETTVTLRGQGLGGRNQELALAFALEARRVDLRCHWVFLSAGTDGRDGPTDAAGAIVDGGTLERGRSAGKDPERALAENDSYRFLDAAGDLLRTGPTGTNVADLQVVIVAGAHG